MLLFNVYVGLALVTMMAAWYAQRREQRSP
jgi:hypothetical protein